MRKLIFVLLMYVSSQALATPKVVVIGVDGMGGQYVKNFAPTPTMDKMAREGASTFAMQNVLPSSSGPNWASMISGSDPTLNGVWSNSFSHSKVETIFKAFRDQNPRANMAVIYEWGKFIKLVEPNVRFNTKEKAGAEQAANKAIDLINNMGQPDFLFLDLDYVDHAGHSHGWGSTQYLEAITKADGQIRQIRNAVQQSGDYDNTYFIVLADHGGYEKGHDYDNFVSRSIPFIITGPGIRVNHKITAHVRIWDLAATVVHIFGLKQPQKWIAEPVLSAFKSYQAPPQPSGKLSYTKTTKNYNRVYWDKGTGAISDVSIWTPVVPDGKVYLAQTAVSNYDIPTTLALVVDDNTELLAPPRSYEKISDDKGSGGDEDVTYWQPIPEAGFTCLSDIVANNYSSTPPNDPQFRCVKTELVTPGEYEWVWFDSHSHANEDTGIWNGIFSETSVPTYAFRARRSHFDFGYNLFYNLKKESVHIDN